MARPSWPRHSLRRRMSAPLPESRTNTDVRPFLRLSGVRKVYPGVVALAGFDLEVRPGEVIGIVGENGAGKSTLMKILGGIVTPDGGTIEIDGVASQSFTVSELHPRRHRFRASGTQPIRQSRRGGQCLHRPGTAQVRSLQDRRRRAAVGCSGADPAQTWRQFQPANSRPQAVARPAARSSRSPRH